MRQAHYVIVILQMIYCSPDFVLCQTNRASQAFFVHSILLELFMMLYQPVDNAVCILLNFSFVIVCHCALLSE
jgi:hypothetical protein